MQTESQIKKETMQIEFGYNVQLEQMRIQRDRDKESFIEDRKDERTRISGTQQSQMIDQRKNNLLPSDFKNNNEEDMSTTGVEPLMP
jgi:hypothetical protein